MSLDKLDKRILQDLSSGISSYEELARTCKVTRNTVYRRIAALERRGIIKNTIRCNVNFDQLGITPICVAIKIAQMDLDKACKLLSAHKNVRLLLRTFGSHNLNFIAFCQKGQEGEVIESINVALENLSVSDIDISVGFVWEKTDLSTIEDQPRPEQELSVIIENNL